MNNISFGSSYKLKYLDKNINGFKHREIKPKNGFIKSYEIFSETPVFYGILSIKNNGCAIINVKYTSYSGVKNKYTNYFNKNGDEIIHLQNNDKIEKKYFDSIQ